MEGSGKISFTSRINFISAKAFKAMLDKNYSPKIFVNEPWTLKESLFSDTFLGTSGINTCSSATIALDNEGFMMHLSSSNSLKNVKSFIEGGLKNLIDSARKKSVLLIGSKSEKTPVISPEYIGGIVEYDLKSSKLFELLKTGFQKYNPTIFEGHKLPNTGTNYFYDVKNNTYYINTMLDMFDAKTSIKNWDDLDKAFEKIIISPKDKVNFIV